MRRMRIAVVGPALAVLLSGCVVPQTLLALVPLLPQPGPVSTPAPAPTDDTNPAEPASGPLAVGSCLDGMIGADSDRDALVGCSGPHLYDVVAIEEWPEMAALLAGGDPGDVYDTLYGDTDQGADYWEWGSRACAGAVRAALGIDDVTVDGYTAGDLWLRLGGRYGVDISLASRDAFVAGDHATVCSAAWYYTGSNPTRISYPSGLGFADLLNTRFGPEWRECRTVDYFSADCSQDHWGQVVAGFEGLTVFDKATLTRIVEGTSTDADWSKADAFCAQLMDATLPPTANPDDVVGYADVGEGYGWDEYEGTIDQPGGYFFDCLVTPPITAELLTGDVIAGTAAVVGNPA